MSAFLYVRPSTTTTSVAVADEGETHTRTGMTVTAHLYKDKDDIINRAITRLSAGLCFIFSFVHFVRLKLRVSCKIFPVENDSNLQLL